MNTPEELYAELAKLKKEDPNEGDVEKLKRWIREAGVETPFRKLTPQQMETVLSFHLDEELPELGGSNIPTPNNSEDESEGSNITIPSKSIDGLEDITVYEGGIDIEDLINAIEPKTSEGSNITTPKPKQAGVKGSNIPTPNKPEDKQGGSNITIPKPKQAEAKGSNITTPNKAPDESEGSNIPTPNKLATKQKGSNITTPETATKKAKPDGRFKPCRLALVINGKSHILSIERYWIQAIQVKFLPKGSITDVRRWIKDKVDSGDIVIDGSGVPTRQIKCGILEIIARG